MTPAKEYVKVNYLQKLKETQSIVHPLHVLLKSVLLWCVLMNRKQRECGKGLKWEGGGLKIVFGGV